MSSDFVPDQPMERREGLPTEQMLPPDAGTADADREGQGEPVDLRDREEPPDLRDTEAPVDFRDSETPVDFRDRPPAEP